jgi:4a-hydroxytetrahydrobiopterin dehydratase
MAAGTRRQIVDTLAAMKCIPCQGNEPALTEREILEFLPFVPAWELAEEKGVRRLRRTFKFKDFSQALAFSNVVGTLAEAEGHHPVLRTKWGRVTVTWWTHSIKGLHRNDFIMAAKTDAAYGEA